VARCRAFRSIEQGNAWILHARDTVRRDRKDKAAPPVLEFDEPAISSRAGARVPVLTAEIEHGINADPRAYLDRRNGKTDNLYKFTKDGKFVMQIEKSAAKQKDTATSRTRPTSSTMRRPTSSFVADG